MSAGVLRVSIAVIERDGCYVIGVRPPGKPLAGFSEFPGGKCEPGEHTAACAVRECREETGLDIVADVELLQHQFRYAHGELSLSFWQCRLLDTSRTEPQHGFRWVPAAELWSLKFPEANAPLMTFLKQRHAGPL
jgi:8-oxo-dGTP diphosphatase